MNGIEKITERINKDAEEEILRAKESLAAEIAALFAKTPAMLPSFSITTAVLW